MFPAQVLDQFFHLAGGERVKRRTGLVQQPHFRLASNRPAGPGREMRESEKIEQAGQTETECRTPRRRHFLVNGFIAAFLLFQIVVPLTYYTSGRDNDERFAWRMFSTVRQQLLSQRARAVIVKSTEENDDSTQHVTPVHQVLSRPWIEFLEQDQQLVVDKFLQWQCEQDNCNEVRLEVSRWNEEGESLPAVRHSLDCAAGEFRTSEPTP